MVIFFKHLFSFAVFEDNAIYCPDCSVVYRVPDYESRINEIKHVHTDKPLHQFMHKNH